MATFVEELDEHVHALDRDLVGLEREPAPRLRAELVATLFRTAHSLKGAARSVNVTPVERVCHELETMLAAAREEAHAFSPDLFGLLFEVSDAVKDAGRRLRAGRSLAGGPLDDLLPRLRAAAVTAAAREPRAEAGAEPEDLEDPQRPLGSSPTAAAGETVVRISARKLDGLLARSGELLVARSRGEARAGELAALQELVRSWRDEWERSLARGARGPAASEREGLPLRGRDQLRRLSRELTQLAAVLASDRHALDRAAVPLDDDLRRMRMLPFSEACAGLERAVRDLAMGDKAVDLVLEGGDVELDRAILEGLKDPLLHLVRNALDHGIEPPAERREAGKPERGRITVSAALRGSGVEISVADDGRGLDLSSIREKARAKSGAEPLGDAEAMRLVFRSGFSTSPMVTEVSGRGIGLDVVRARVEALRGSVDLSSEPGRGSRFVLMLPLTLSVVRALFVEAAGQVYALAAVGVRQVVRVAPEEVGSVEGREVLKLGGVPVPLVALASVLGIDAARARPAGRKLLAVLLGSGPDRTAFVVDELLYEQEVVVKSLGPRVGHVGSVSGAVILPSGRVALLLNAGSLVESARSVGPGAPHLRASLGSDAAPERRRRLLVAEDSVTTRTLVKTVLEADGFDVLAVVDGLAGWHALQDQEVDLVISDVDMPRMDGFSLVESIRASHRLRSLPVILVTALGSDEDRQRGLRAGANAYLVKSAFDQRLLTETIRQLL